MNKKQATGICETCKTKISCALNDAQVEILRWVVYNRPPMSIKGARFSQFCELMDKYEEEIGVLGVLGVLKNEQDI